MRTLKTDDSAALAPFSILLRRLRLRGLLALALFAMALSASAQDFKLQASLEPSRIEAGEATIYSITVYYDTQSPPAPEPPKFDPNWGFGQPKFEGTQTQTQVINGSVSRAVTFSYSFSVSKEGTFAIPPAAITFNGKSYQSNSVSLTVAKSNLASVVPQELQDKVVPPQVPGDQSLRNALTGVVFVLPVIETQTPYNGQQVIVTYHLAIDQAGLTQAGLHGNSLVAPEVAPPEMKQFLKEEMFPIPKQFQFRETKIGSKRYLTAPLYQAAITPTKSGKLTIEPFRITLLFGSARARRSGMSNDPFLGQDPFEDSFFGSMSPLMGGNRVRVVALAPQLDLDVKPLPEAGKPADFSGAVGEFNVTTSLDKPQVVANEDILKLDVKIEGKGDASGLSKPQLPNLDGVTVLEEPKASTQHRTENEQFYSSKTFTYLLRPTKPGKLEIPPIAYAIFSPKVGEYMHVQSEPVSAEVKPSTQKQVALVAPSSSSPGTSTDKPAENEGPREINQDINYIHTGALQAVQPGALSGEGAGFILLLLFPPALLASGYVVGRRRVAYENNRAYYREVIAGDTARKRLRKLRKLLKGGDHLAFYAELAGATRGYFADKFHLDPSGLTVDQIEEQLRERDYPEELLVRVRLLLEESDMARYAPVKAEPDVMLHAYDDTMKLLQEVEKIR